jgi:peptidoglycan DL-endopeptidase CwlO
MIVRSFICLMCFLVAAPMSHAVEQTFGQTLKKIFSTPTPTPHRKAKTTTAAKKKSPTPTPSPTASPKRKKSSPTPLEESPAPNPKNKKVSPSPTEPPQSHRKKKTSPTATPTETETPTPSASGSPHRKKKKTSPTPEESESPTATPAPTESPSKTTAPKRGAPNATLMPNQIKGFENYPLKVQKLLTSALELTTRNLDYKYGSADPSSGGMDCSGFVYYVLKQNEIPDVPRDSSQQYVWLRRARQFEPVLSEKDDSFELEDLKPGDLLFWTGTYSIDRDPPITHAMIYLGREKKTGNRVMVGASDGRVYQGESRFGVSVFDFKIQRRETNGDGKLRPTFIGYGHLPGLQQ